MEQDRLEPADPAPTQGVSNNRRAAILRRPSGAEEGEAAQSSGAHQMG